MNAPILGIVLGDAGGVGPEIVAKMLSRQEWRGKYRPLVIGSARVLELGMGWAKANVPYKTVQTPDEFACDMGVLVLDDGAFDLGEIQPGTAILQSGRAMLEMLKRAVELWREGHIGGFTYAPLNKSLLHGADGRFSGETDVVKHFGAVQGRCIEINLADGLWTARATGHIPVSQISANLTTERVLDTIRVTHQCLCRAGREKPRLFVAALNPHAGEGGLFGGEEREVIAPAVELAQREGILAQGPYPADTVFMRGFAGECDAVVTMYHDQGQIALKTRSFGKGVTLIAGLPFVMTTPAHGVGYDIAGKGIAKEGSMALAADIAGSMLKG